MTSPVLTDELRRFIHSIRSIPHLEAILLLRENPSQSWQADTLANRLYITVEIVENVLVELAALGIVTLSEKKISEYRYNPSTPLLAELIDMLAHYYAHHLIEVTNMIHTRHNQNNRLLQFADAFRFQKKDE
jgi:hypothetical protein